MKIKLKTLRNLIREGIISELGMSPAVFQQNKSKLLSDPMENGNISKAVGEFERSFNTVLLNNLVLAHSDKYDAETREFDDDTYNQLKDIASAATENAMSKIDAAFKMSWSSAIKQSKDIA